MASSVKSQPNHYEILGLTPAATKRQISEAYAARINKYLVPPDDADPGARDEARRFMAAYKTLSDPQQRRAYDASLARKSQPAPEPQDRSEAPADPEVAPFIATGPSETDGGREDLPASSSPPDGVDTTAAGGPKGEEIAQSATVAAAGYSLGYFARKHNLSREQARELMERVGNDREKLNAAAEQLKAAPEPSPAVEPSPAAEPSPTAEPSPAVEPSPTVEPSAAAEPSPAPEPSPAAAADFDDSLHEQPSWEPAADESSAASGRRLPTAAKVGAALLGLAVIAGAGLLLGGYLDLTGSTPGDSDPSSLQPSPNRSAATGNTAPQGAIPDPATSQLPDLLGLSPSEAIAPLGSAAAPTTAELARSVQAAPPGAAVQKPSSGPVPPGAPQSADASPPAAQAGTTATGSTDELAPSAAPSPAAQPTVTQALSSPPATPTVKTLPKLLAGGIGGKDNPRGRFQGIVTVKFTVEPNGRVSGCTTAASSGSSGLDFHTCQLVEQRLRFSPALDAQDRPVPWTMNATYMWGHKNWRGRRR